MGHLVDGVLERRAPIVPFPSHRLTYAFQRREPAIFLALRPGQGVLGRIPLDGWPSLPPLPSWRRVRGLRRYYAPLRLPVSVPPWLPS